MPSVAAPRMSLSLVDSASSRARSSSTWSNRAMLSSATASSFAMAESKRGVRLAPRFHAAPATDRDSAPTACP